MVPPYFAISPTHKPKELAMADNTAITPENTSTPQEEHTADAAGQVAAATAPEAGQEQAAPEQTAPTEDASTQGAQEPAEPQPVAAEAPAPAAPKPSKPMAVPSPAALAHKAPHIKAAPAAPAYSQEEIDKAESFGRVDEQGNVFVREGDQERQVGQFPNADSKEALNLYARRYLDLKEKLNIFASRLHSPKIKAREIDESIASLKDETSQPEAVGDLAALRTQLDQLAEQGQARKDELAQARKDAMAKAIKERTAIVEKAEELAASLGDSTNWRSTADKFRSLFEQWQQHQRTTIRIDKADADALWKRFSSARTTFNQARRRWAQQRDAQRSETKRIKEEIIAEADQIKDSTDWGPTSHQFNELMDRWKQAGRAGRQDDDALWARFRQAADVFFNARQADRDKTSINERENLTKKEALVAKAEALLPVKDAKAAKQARQELAKIQEEWDSIGFVPRDDVRRIEGRMDAVDRQIKTVEDAAWNQSDPESDARVSSFEQQLAAQLQDLDRQIAAEQDPVKKQELEAEKATKEQWMNAVR